MMNFYVDEEGTLKVFDGNDLAGEVQQCQEMTEGEVQCLADEIYEAYVEIQQAEMLKHSVKR